MHMDMEVRDIDLDKKNPRFSFFNNFGYDEEIIEYMFEYDDLKALINNILDNNYDSLGKRPIVLKNENECVMLEGNRRLCALKCILGLLDHKYLSEKNQKYINKICKHPNYNSVYNAIQKIEVDTVSNRDEALRSLAEIHINGVSRWDKNAKLAFYGKRFETNTVEEILKYTPDSKTDVRNMLKRYIWVKEWEKILGEENLQNVSYITERLQNFFRLQLKYVIDIDVNETLSKSKVVLNEQLPYDEFKDIIKKTYSFMKNGELDSRTGGTVAELETFFEDKGIMPLGTVKSEQSISVKKNKFYIDEVEEARLLDIFNGLSGRENVKLFDSNLRPVNSLSEFGVGSNVVEVNGKKYEIEVLSLEQPSINRTQLDIKTNIPINIEDMFNFTNHHGEKINYKKDIIKVTTDNSNIKIEGSSLTFVSTSNNNINVEFVYDKNKSPITLSFNIKVKKHSTSGANKNNNIFTSSCVPNLVLNDTIKEFGKQIDNALSNEDYILVMCTLRTFLEIRVYDFYEESKKYVNSLVDTSKPFNLSEFFLKFVSFIAQDGSNRNSIEKFYTDFTSQYGVSYKRVTTYMDSFHCADYDTMLNQFNTLTHTGTTMLDPDRIFSDNIIKDLLRKIEIINEFILFYENATTKF